MNQDTSHNKKPMPSADFPASALNCHGVPISPIFNLGEHTVEIAADHSLTLIDNAAYQQVSNFTATETISLSSEEVYHLLMLLQTLFA